MKLLKAKEKKERALGTKLGLKAYRSNSPKSAMIRRPYRPGQHGKKSTRSGSEFKQQLAEKQKIKLSYGLTERQMQKIFERALGTKKASVHAALLELFESRLDNVVYRLGFAPSRIMARHLVSHGHFTVNGRKTNIPSYMIKVGDVVAVNPTKKNSVLFKELSGLLKKGTGQSWLKVDAEKLEGTATALPENIDLPFNINLVIDYYSR